MSAATTPYIRISPTPLVVLSTLVVGLLMLLPPLPAYALERRPFGDVEVSPGERASEVSTMFGDVSIRGPVVGSVESGSGNISIEREVGGNVSSSWGDVEVNAPVGGTVAADFGDVYINSMVGGDVDVEHGDVVIGPRASIAGNVRCDSGSVGGNVGAVQGTVMTGMASNFEGYPKDSPGGFSLFGIVGWMLAALGFAACSLLVAVLAPRVTTAAARSLERSPVWSLLLGLGSVPVAFVLSVLLAVSIVGAPLMLLFAPAYLAFVFFGAIIAAFFLGRRVVLATGRYGAGNALAAIVGALLISVAYLIPYLGLFILCALALLGTGATMLAIFSRRRPRI